MVPRVPKGIPGDPKLAQDGSKQAPRTCEELPRETLRWHNLAPRRPKEDPRRTPSVPSLAQDGRKWAPQMSKEFRNMARDGEEMPPGDHRGPMRRQWGLMEHPWDPMASHWRCMGTTCKELPRETVRWRPCGAPLGCHGRPVGRPWGPQGFPTGIQVEKQ